MSDEQTLHTPANDERAPALEAFDKEGIKARLRARLAAAESEANSKKILVDNFKAQWVWSGIEERQPVELQQLAPSAPDEQRGEELRLRHRTDAAQGEYRPTNRYARVYGLRDALKLLHHAAQNFQAQGLYLLGNRLKAAVADKAKTNVWIPFAKDGGTTDADIAARAVVMLDIDPRRKDGVKDISATEEERQHAIKRALDLYGDLAEVLGSEDDLAFVSSGNGAQVHVRVDLPNVPEVTNAIKRTLLVLDQIYSTETEELDTAVSDPKRLFPACGTWKRKGANNATSGRVHRPALFIPGVERPGALSTTSFLGMLATFEARVTQHQKAAVEKQMGVSVAGFQARGPATPRTGRRQSDLARANETPISDVLRKLDVDPNRISCPFCSATTGVDSLEAKGINATKCLHATCGARTAWPVDWVAKLVFHSDQLRGSKGLAGKVLGWFADNFGLDVCRSEERAPVTVGITDVTLPEDASPEQLATSFPCTDLGNGERLVHRYGADLRYCAVWDKWLVWDDKRWQVANRKQVERFAQLTVRSIYAEARDENDPDRRRALADHAKKSESNARKVAMIEQAKSLPGIPIGPDELDADPWLFNVQNGTIDLRTGVCREHRRADLITKIARAEYDPDATCHTYDAFLERVLPDPGVRELAWRLDGYALTGVVHDHVFPIKYGAGRNGKGVHDNTMLHVFGDYARQIPTELLMAKRGDSHPTEKTTLFGTRLALATETEEGRVLNVAFVKQMTGGDKISARRMREDFWEFDPTHKVQLSTNHKPVIRETKDAMWERVLLIPWTVQIPKAERDKRLAEKLQGEASGILARLVRACLDWQRDGLSVPDAVRLATDSYREDMDVLGTFLGDLCVVVAGAHDTADRLFTAYEKWAEGNNERGLSQTKFGTSLSERGFERVRDSKTGRTMWRGLRLSDTGMVVDEAAARGAAEGSERSEPHFRLTAHENGIHTQTGNAVQTIQTVQDQPKQGLSENACDTAGQVLAASAGVDSDLARILDDAADLGVQHAARIEEQRRWLHDHPGQQLPPLVMCDAPVYTENPDDEHVRLREAV